MTENKIPDIYSLSPVEQYGNFFVKREDLFRLGAVNGGKLRQALYLMVDAKEKGALTFMTGSSYLSPQLPIVATVARELNTPAHLFTGASPRTYTESHYGKVALAAGAEVHYSRCARNNALYADIRKYSPRLPSPFIIEQGMTSMDDRHYFDLLSRQVSNCPDAENFVIICGSAMNSIGVLHGIAKYGKRYKNILLLGVAPNRNNKIQAVAQKLGLSIPAYTYIDAHSRLPGYKYENTYSESIGNIKLHPRYEAKAMRFLRRRRMAEASTHFWIGGGEIGFHQN